MMPSNFPKLRFYPDALRFIKTHLDMQFDDVRTMLKLPRSKRGLTGGCNFASTAMLCNLISGISVILYRPLEKMRRGDRFKNLLKDFYPWASHEDKEERSKIIYDLIRNPLAHSLGVLYENSEPLHLAKGFLTEWQLRKIEQSESKPEWLPLTVTALAHTKIVDVRSLYWGVFHMLRRLTEDRGQMETADLFIRQGISIKKSNRRK